MKDGRKYSKEIQKLYRSLKHNCPKIEECTYDEPVKAIVYALISEDTTESVARSAIKKFDDYFVDFNDLRVSRDEEIIDQFGADTVENRAIASKITLVLRSIFDKYNVVSLEELRKTGKRPAKQAIEKLEGISRFAVDYCMLTSLQGHAIPLTKKMIEYLRCEQTVHPDADEQEIDGFLTRQISAGNAYQFYYLLRLASETAKAKAKKKAVKKVKKAKEVVKKTATKTKKTNVKKKTKKKAKKKTNVKKNT